MRNFAYNNLSSPPFRQRGAALLALLALVLTASSYSLLQALNKTESTFVRNAENVKILNQAKMALIGYALSSQSRPGELPCPDYNNDPEGNDGLSDPCLVTAGLVTPGHLPWRTLGLPNLRDHSGETLWYVPAIEFDGSVAINSDTAESLLFDSNPVVALLLAPGSVVNNQSRPQNAAALDDRTRYFEGLNAITDASFSSSPINPGDEFNDQITAISRKELMRGVERRVLRELANALIASTPPNAVNATSDSCSNSSSIEQGFLPESTLPGVCSNFPVWPAWFQDNNWNQVIWYVVKPTCTTCFTVSEASQPDINAQVILIAAASAINSQARPATNVTDLLDSTENSNGDDTFEILTLSFTSNDQIEIVQ